MFELKPDFENVLNRFEAWWDCQILDRPLVSIPFFRKESERIQSPTSTHTTLRERWMDTDFLVAQAQVDMQNTVFYADALPVFTPNLGPEVFSAFYGCPLEFGEHTSWSEPILHDWSEKSLAKIQLDENNVYFRKILEMTNALLEVARGRFIVGYTDLHGGGDAIAAFMDPQKLLIGTIEYPNEIKSLCERITTDFLRVYDLYHDKLTNAGMPSTTWCPAICRGTFHIPSNDFSCMISDYAFKDLFIPSIIRECRHMDRNLYHLDGPQALRYLDILLDIPEIHAIQWVPGARQEHWADSIEVYQRIQNRGKALQILSVPAADLCHLFEALRPEGVWISSISGITDQEQAKSALKKIAKWTSRK